MINTARDSERYYPPPESQGGWRWLMGAEAIRDQAGIDAAKLDQAMQRQEWLYGGDSWGIAIIRHGYLVREHYTFNVLIPTRFDVWSCTKTLDCAGLVDGTGYTDLARSEPSLWLYLVGEYEEGAVARSATRYVCAGGVSRQSLLHYPIARSGGGAGWHWSGHLG
jgi:hypothetical protein